MSKHMIAHDRGVRHGDISASADPSGTVTVTVGTGDDHDHLELTEEQALRLSDVLAAMIDWGV